MNYHLPWVILSSQIAMKNWILTQKKVNIWMDSSYRTKPPIPSTSNENIKGSRWSFF